MAITKAQQRVLDRARELGVYLAVSGHDPAICRRLVAMGLLIETNAGTNALFARYRPA